MESKVYNQKGEEVGVAALPKSVFGVPWNADLVHQVVVAMLANRRTPVAHAKDRSDVRGGGKKPWRQKGTGRARHGSIRSPIWRGGGATFGPRNEKHYSQKINKKMRIKALYSALSRKYKDNEVLFVDSLGFSEPKSSEAKRMLVSLSSVPNVKRLAGKKKNAAMVLLPAKDAAVAKSFQNFGNIAVDTAGTINPVDVLTYTYLIIADPKASVAALEKRGKL